MYFSLVIPVFNRPQEIKELLESLVASNFKNKFEVIVVEDGSTDRCETIVATLSDKLNISYYYKQNSGPGASRNFGMNKAEGDYFLLFDSDCIIPQNYLTEVEKELAANFVDCYGGPDKDLKTFSKTQKAINFAMTSFMTTGGIRGGSEAIDTFQPRSFNMGISKKAFQISKGFGNIHPGEDPDLSMRLWKLGFKSRLLKNAFVYHKRRIDWDKFELQVSKFGKARPILNSWHPEFAKITYWFPTLFIVGFYLSILLLVFAFDWLLKVYFVYFILIFIVSMIQNKNLFVGFASVKAVWKQFYGYGFGFLESFVKISLFKKKPQKVFPELFFENSNTATKIIGLTGGIGSGKTTIANYLLSKGIPVFVSDLEAKKVMELPEVISKIATSLGDKILNENKTINRDKLSELVFKNPEKLKLLNSIVHPEVKKHYEKWVQERKNYLYVVKETAILFESGSYKDCDITITITAPLETRIKRVMERDATTREKVLARINNQISDEERIAKSDYVIDNSNIETAKIKIDEILKIMSI